MKLILNETFNPYMAVIYKVLGLYAVVVLATIVDLIAGIRKSRKNGIKITHSYGFRKTLNKLAKYFNLLLAANTLDAGMIISGIPQYHGLPMLPYVTAFMTMILCIVEGYSVWEKDEDKGKYIEAAKVAKEVVNAVDMDVFTDRLSDGLIKKLEEKQTEDENKNNSSLSSNNNADGTLRS